MNKKFRLRDSDIIQNCAKYILSDEMRKECERKEHEVIIQEYKKDVTAEQRAFFNGVLVRAISQETGYSEAEVKEMVKKYTHGVNEVTIGNSTHYVTTSSESGREKMSELIEGAYRLAAEANIQLPSPRYVQ
jgi:hypothetical protein